MIIIDAFIAYLGALPVAVINTVHLAEIENGVPTVEARVKSEELKKSKNI